MNSRVATQIVTLGLAIVTMVITLGVSSQAKAARYRIELYQDTKLLSSRTVDSSKPQGTTQIHGGLALEIEDETASCGIFLQPQGITTNVIVTIIENVKNPDLKSVETKSGVLAKQAIAPKNQDVTPGADGTRQVTANSTKLNRSCTVSVI